MGTNEMTSQLIVVIVKTNNYTKCVELIIKYYKSTL